MLLFFVPVGKAYLMNYKPWLQRQTEINQMQRLMEMKPFFELNNWHPVTPEEGLAPISPKSGSGTWGEPGWHIVLNIDSEEPLSSLLLTLDVSLTFWMCQSSCSSAPLCYYFTHFFADANGSTFKDMQSKRSGGASKKCNL